MKGGGEIIHKCLINPLKTMLPSTCILGLGCMGNAWYLLAKSNHLQWVKDECDVKSLFHLTTICNKECEMIDTRNANMTPNL